MTVLEGKLRAEDPDYVFAEVESEALEARGSASTTPMRSPNRHHGRPVSNWSRLP